MCFGRVAALTLLSDASLLLLLFVFLVLAATATFCAVSYQNLVVYLISFLPLI